MSGTAVLDIEIPSGYGIVMSEALELVASGIHPTLRDSIISPGKTSWYFDYVSLSIIHTYSTSAMELLLVTHCFPSCFTQNSISFPFL